MTYSTYKTVSFTPKGSVADLIYGFCAPGVGNNFRSMQTNPQDVIRAALFNGNVIGKHQPSGLGDRSLWKPGESIKTSLWAENHADLTNFAKEQGMNKQQVISECVVDYINSQT